jgi:hypothetical protein
MAELIAILRNMPDWQIMLGWSIGIFGLAIISFIFHKKTPPNRKSKEIVHPFSFMLLVAIATLFIAYILYLLDI